jgi:hypothetical protein
MASVDKRSASERTLSMFDRSKETTLEHQDDFDDEPTIPSMRLPVFIRTQVAVSGFLTPIRLMAFTGIFASCFVAAGAFVHDLDAIGVGGLVLIAGNIQALVRR